MLRWLTSGESHGKSLVGILEGLPAGVSLTTSDVQERLARRRLGYGRGARMKFEQDQVNLLGASGTDGPWAVRWPSRWRTPSGPSGRL